ncbi:hypothetical protein LCGC14_0417120 [marine sediment metagenome]|uniref:Uncharacterized protein n=1 Tax=marine sediment metagenome TaxID=412755 RepID=A0A0F9W1D8_9ZZZZ
MRILNDKEIFGSPYEEALQPPPYEDWELLGRHVKVIPPPDTSRPSKKERRIIEDRRTSKGMIEQRRGS